MVGPSFFFCSRDPDQGSRIKIAPSKETDKTPPIPNPKGLQPVLLSNTSFARFPLALTIHYRSLLTRYILSLSSARVVSG